MNAIRRYVAFPMLVAFALFARAHAANAAPPLQDAWAPPVWAPARAQARDAAVDATPSPPDTWSTRKNVVSLGGGLGGPMGFGGLTYEYAPARWLVLGSAVGFGNRAALTFGFWPRLRWPVLRWLAIGIGVPFSLSPSYLWDSGGLCAADYTGSPRNCDYHVSRQWTVALFAHIEPNLEFRAPWGGALRLYAGRSFVLNPSDGRCTANFARGCPSSGGEVQTYAGLTLGYAF